MKKRIISCLLLLAMAISLIPHFEITANAALLTKYDMYDAAQREREKGGDFFFAWYHTVMCEQSTDQMLLGRCEKLLYNDFTEAAKDDSISLGAKAIWAGLNTDFELTEEDLYSSLLLKMVAGDFTPPNQDTPILDMTLRGMEDAWHPLLEFLCKWFKAANIQELYNSAHFAQLLNEENAKELIEAFKEAEKEGVILAEDWDKFGNFFDLFQLIVDAMKTGKEAIETLTWIYHIIEGNKQCQLVLNEMANNPDNPWLLRNAAEDLYFYMTTEEYNAYITATLQQIVGMGWEVTRHLYADGIKAAISTLDPWLYAATFAVDVFLGLTDEITSLYTMFALAEMEDAVFDAVAVIRENFRSTQSLEYASAYKAGLDMCYTFAYQTCYYVNEHLDNVYTKGLLKKWFPNFGRNQDCYEIYKNIVAEAQPNILKNYHWAMSAPDQLYNGCIEKMDGECLVVYHANGGTNTPLSHTKTFSGMVTISNEVPEREGYEFVHWAVGDPVDYIHPVLPGYSIDVGDGDLHLYAIWKEIAYTVYFNPNGGTGGPVSALKYGGSTLMLPTKAPTCAGYRFLGWAHNASATEPDYLPGGYYRLNGIRTLYAVWEASDALPDSFEKSMDMVDFSSTAIGVTKGRIRYMTQLTGDRACYVPDYWTYTANGTAGTVYSGNKCTRCALSMALSYLGLDYTPGYMSTLYGSAEILSPLADVPKLIPEIERVYDDFDTLMYNYACDANFSPVVIYFDYTHSVDSTTHKHAILLIGKNGDTFYAVDSAANITKLVEVTLNADRTAIVSSSIPHYAADSVITAVCQWKRTGTDLNPSRVYTITYDWGDWVNGAVQTVKHDTKKHGEAYTITSEIPTYSGYGFGGWALGEDLSNPVYGPGDTYLSNADLYLYAVWHANGIPTTISLSGTVKNATVGSTGYGSGIAGVTVTFLDSKGACAGTAVTDTAGGYSFDFENTGMYKQIFEKDGFVSVTVDSLIVTENTPSMGTVVMFEEAAEEEESRNIIAEGTCGADLTWALDDTGLLTVDGTGAMDATRWTNYAEDILRVRIGDSVTSIGYYAFRNCTKLSEVYLGAGLTTLNGYAFEYCSALKTITVPDALSSIGTDVFNGAPIQTVIIPSTVTSVSSALYNLSSIKEFIVYDTDGVGPRSDNGVLYYYNPYTEALTLIRCPQSKGITGTYT
ncbi:MAG: InlB B-repeat-containing protein, partial [Clostridia bacterium]|nr:InlB B-repeat-containing protein [Clostridia bacterium]